MTEGIKIEIDKDAVQRAIVDAVIKSSIGDELQKAVQKCFEPSSFFGADRRSVFEKIVEGEVQRIVGVVVREQLDARKPEIAEKVKAAISDEVLGKMLGAATDFIFERLQSRD